MGSFFCAQIRSHFFVCWCLFPFFFIFETRQHSGGLLATQNNVRYRKRHFKKVNMYIHLLTVLVAFPFFWSLGTLLMLHWPTRAFLWPDFTIDEPAWTTNMNFSYFSVFHENYVLFMAPNVALEMVGLIAGIQNNSNAKMCVCVCDDKNSYIFDFIHVLKNAFCFFFFGFSFTDGKKSKFYVSRVKF